MKIYLRKSVYNFLTSKLFMGVFTFLILGLAMAVASGVIVKNGNIDAVDLNASGNVNANLMSVSKVYMSENGIAGGATNVYFQERPSVNTRRIMMYGNAQSDAFGFIVSPTGTTAKNSVFGLWTADLDNAGTPGNQKSIAQLILDKDSRDMKFSTGTGGGGGIAGNISFAPNGIEVLKVNKDGSVVVNGDLVVSGNLDVAGCLRVAGEPTMGTCN